LNERKLTVILLFLFTLELATMHTNKYSSIQRKKVSNFQMKEKENNIRTRLHIKYFWKIITLPRLAFINTRASQRTGNRDGKTAINHL